MINRDEQADLKKLADAVFKKLFINDCEYGAIGVHPKRPFNNSDVDGDILEIIGEKPLDDDGFPYWTVLQRKYANNLYHKKLIPYIQTRWADLQ